MLYEGKGGSKAQSSQTWFKPENPWIQAQIFLKQLLLQIENAFDEVPILWVFLLHTLFTTLWIFLIESMDVIKQRLFFHPHHYQPEFYHDLVKFLVKSSIRSAQLTRPSILYDGDSNFLKPLLMPLVIQMDAVISSPFFWPSL